MRKEHFCTTETPQNITEISRKCHGKSRKITENHGKSRNGFFMPITEIVESLAALDERQQVAAVCRELVEIPISDCTGIVIMQFKRCHWKHKEFLRTYNIGNWMTTLLWERCVDTMDREWRRSVKATLHHTHMRVKNEVQHICDSQHMFCLSCLSITFSYASSMAPLWKSPVGSLLMLIPCL